MLVTDLLAAVGLSILGELDRWACLQTMMSRPLVIAALTGLALGRPDVGLLTGFLLELLWIGRLPVGATIPPGDTQLSIAVTLVSSWFMSPDSLEVELVLLAALLLIPLARITELLDRTTRICNGRLSQQADSLIDAENYGAIMRLHFMGAGFFALSGVLSFLFLTGAGYLLVETLSPWLLAPVAAVKNWLLLVFPMVGISSLMGTINVNRSMALFSFSFGVVFLMLWFLK